MNAALRNIVIASLTATLSATTPASAGLGRMLHGLFGTPSWEELPARVSSPREICAQVLRRVTYAEDGEQEEWATGAETWQRGYGDCEDFARTVADLCEAIGLEAKVYILLPTDSPIAHAITLGTWNGRTWISSNGAFHEVRDMVGARRFVAKEMDCDWRTMLVMQPSSDISVTTAAHP